MANEPVEGKKLLEGKAAWVSLGFAAASTGAGVLFLVLTLYAFPHWQGKVLENRVENNVILIRALGNRQENLLRELSNAVGAINNLTNRLDLRDRENREFQR